MRNLLTFVLLWCTILSAYAQDVQIKGVVISGEDNLPLPGVNVVVKGTTIGTTTDFDGQFSFAAPAKSLLVVSYIGYKPQELVADATKSMRIVLREDSEVLEEVVVVGYGTVKRKDVTTSVATVSTEDLDQRPLISAASAIQGKAAGVNVIQPNGEPGAGIYEDVKGFCRSVPLAEIAQHGHVLTPGRYVGAEEVEDDDEAFADKMQKLTEKLGEQMAKGAELDAVIRAKLGGLGYEF